LIRVVESRALSEGGGGETSGACAREIGAQLHGRQGLPPPSLKGSSGHLLHLQQALLLQLDPATEADSCEPSEPMDADGRGMTTGIGFLPFAAPTGAEPPRVRRCGRACSAGGGSWCRTGSRAALCQDAGAWNSVPLAGSSGRYELAAAGPFEVCAQLRGGAAQAIRRPAAKSGDYVRGFVPGAGEAHFRQAAVALSAINSSLAESGRARSS
jgi:hypothetical protein